MSLRAAFVFALLCSQTVLAHAQEVPTLDTPELREKLAVITSEYAKWQGNPTAYFTMPAQGLPMTCAAAQTLMKAGAGIIDWATDPEMKRAAAYVERSSGLRKGSVTGPQFTDIQMVVVKGGCDGEVAKGEFDAWIDYKMVNDSEHAVSTNRYMVHITGRFGAPGATRPAQQVVARRDLGSSTVWKDPETAKMMASHRGPTITSHSFDVVDAGGRVMLFAASMDGGRPTFSTTVELTRKAGDDSFTVMRQYQGRVITSEAHYRNSVPHGPMKMFAHRNTQIGIDIPGSEKCYDNGEQIKTLRCDVQ